MDKTDKKILEVLQKNSQITNQELADKVALSASPCLRRVKHLEQEGYIKKQVALLEPKKIGLNLTIFVLVGLDTHEQKKMEAFNQALLQLDEVIECYLITGQSADYLLKVMVPDMPAYDDFLLKKLTNIKGVSSIQSNFALRSIKNETALPLCYI